MTIINYREKEINCKIVYYGPGLGGKTTNIMAIHSAIPERKRSELQKVDTEGDRTLFFEQFAVKLADCGGMNLRFMVYGVPGQSYYKSTRRVVLQGCDGIVFVADSELSRKQDNINSMRDMKDLLEDNGLDYATLPMVLQYNKRDLDDILPVEEMERDLNWRELQTFNAIALEGIGVQETFQAICKQVVDKMAEDFTLKT